MRHRLMVLAALLPLSCAAPGTASVETPPDVAVLAPGALGPSTASPTDADLQAMTIAEYAFADAARTYGRPADAARAAAAVDYLAGQFMAAPRWGGLDGQTKADMQQARSDVRAAIGAAPGASSQQLVDALAAAGDALALGDTAAAERALTGPAFALPPDQVLQRLANLPYLRLANVATHEAVASGGF